MIKVYYFFPFLLKFVFIFSQKYFERIIYCRCCIGFILFAIIHNSDGEAGRYEAQTI